MRNNSTAQAIDGDSQSKLICGEEGFRALVRATCDVVYCMSPDWRELRYFDGNTCGADSSPSGSSWLERYIPAEDRPTVLAAIGDAVASGGVFKLEHRVIREDGTIGWMFSRAIPIKDRNNEVVEWCGAACDVTERRQREDALREANEHKDQFIAVLAHELRNPLAPMTNALELLRKAEGNERVREMAQQILERQLGALTRLVDDLLETARIASGRLEVRSARVELRTILERAVETTRPSFQGRNQSLTVSIRSSRQFDADAARLQQVFVNLLNNAAKYTDPGGHISLTADAMEDHAVVRVKDTGIGIDPELLPRLFEPFSQAKRARSRSEGGLGLGLSIARRLAELHGGTISVESTPGKGSEFTVRLPLKAPT